jgi:prepilin peptidase CpaA
MSLHPEGGAFRDLNQAFIRRGHTPQPVPCGFCLPGVCALECRAVIEYAVILVFPAAMAFAGAMDLLTMTIPNRVSIVLVAAFAVAAAMMGIGWWVLASHVAAGLTMLVIGIAMFALGWLGGGDAKLLAATALWLGFDHLLPYLLLAGMAGGALAIGLIAYRHMLPPLWLTQQNWAMRLHHAKTGIPYGIALAAAGLHVFPSTLWFATAGI